MMFTIAVAGGTAASKILKSGLIVAVANFGRSLGLFAQDVIGDPPGNIGDLVSTAAQEGLAFSLAVLFIALLITRRVKVVDPDEKKALEEMQKLIEGQAAVIKALESKVDLQSSIVESTKDRAKMIESKLDSILRALT